MGHTHKGHKITEDLWLLSTMKSSPDVLPASFLPVAIAAVRAAAIVTTRVQARLDEVRAITKDDASPVTVADLASQAAIATMLAEQDPSLVLVGEEDSSFLRQPVHASQLDATLEAARWVLPEITQAQLLDAIDLGNAEPRDEGFWTLDPIDGTKGFLRGQQYAIALAYIVRGRPVVAVMGCPNLSLDTAQLEAIPHGTGCLFIASEHEATRCEPIRGEHAPSVSARVHCNESDRPLVTTGSVEGAYSETDWSGRSFRALAEHGFVLGERLKMDSQAKYAAVARGQADAYLRLPSRPGYVEAIWDHAAGSLIAQQAGAIVTDIDGQELDFSTGERLTRNRGIVCAAPAIHAPLVEAIREQACSV